VASRLRILSPVVSVAVLVIAGFAALLCASRSFVGSGPVADEPYNLMVEGFRSGHVWLAKAAPAPLAQAAKPYDFATYRPYLGQPWNLTDLSYYRGHLYAYFGATPAVILFWPYRLLAGGMLRQAHAVLGFCVLGYVLAVGLAVAFWRRYFPEVGPWAGAAIALLLGSVTTLPVFLVRPGLYEVSISCAFALSMLSLAALWNAWHRDRGKGPWLAAASLAYGLAVGARPSLLFGAAILFLPAAAALWSPAREHGHRPWLGRFLCALLPISAVGAGLAAYNFYRFDDPFQFGHDYQLSGNNVTGTRSFDPRFFWDNFRLYFIEPLRWHGGFPFVWRPVCPPLAPGHLPVEFFFGTLTSLPALLAAALVPLAWIRDRSASGPVRGIAAVLLVLFLAGAVPLCSYAGATSRYLLDFIPALALLASIGFLALQARDPGAPGAGDGHSSLAPVLRGVVCCAVLYSSVVAWLLALALGGFYRSAEEGRALLASGRVEAGIAAYGRACRINPDFRGQAEQAVGSALLAGGRTGEGIGYLQAAVFDDPGLEAAHFNLALALQHVGRFKEAAEAFRRATALDPFDAEAEAGLGMALFRQGLVGEAIGHERAALRIDPELADARRNLESLEAPAGSSPGR
jgi:hypothetical protein